MSDESKNKDDKNGSGRNDRTERDGSTQGRRSWPWKVCAALDSCGTDHARPWLSQKGLYKLVMEWHGLRPSDMPQNIGQVIRTLIKSGHIERAHKPERIRTKHATRPEYIYRRTAKAFKQKQQMKDTERAINIKHDYPHLPKWIRDMMI